MTLILGIDDAGRGPLIGPMILAGVLLDKNGETFLKNRNVRDSKVIEHKRRIELSKEIKGTSLGWHVVKSSPKLIDDSISSGINLNTLEAMKTAEIINFLNDGKKKIEVIVDCPSVNTTAWRIKLLEFVDYADNLNVKCEHKADANHISVGAASILAKVIREEEVAKIKKEFGEIGSGYPSDPYTKDFLKKHGKKLSDSGIFRKSWATWKNIFPGENAGQKSLSDF